jgi:hypothetical protein
LVPSAEALAIGVKQTDEIGGRSFATGAAQYRKDPRSAHRCEWLHAHKPHGNHCINTDLLLQKNEAYSTDGIYFK